MPESNKHGSWFGYEIGEKRDVTTHEFQLGASFYKAVMAGAIKASAPEQEAASEELPF